MFQLNDKIYLNQEEQVRKNKEDIAYHMEVTKVLADFGITVLGRVDSFDVIADLDEGDNWGYGYLVGPEDDPNGYVVYVWTRPNADLGKDAPYWLNIGKISIVGPQGPAGRSVTNVSLNSNSQLVFNFSDGSTLTLAQSIRGPQGPSGTNGKTPSITATRETNGVRVKTFNGDGTLTNSVYVADGKQGATGAQGPRGESATLNIIGTFTSIEQAPSARTRELGDAFLLSNGVTTTLYVLTGTPDIISTYSWQETSFGGGTRVTVGGQTQSVWSADSKLDKIDGVTKSVYTFIDPWTTNLTPIDNNTTANSIPVRDGAGTFFVSSPSQTNHPATKGYVDEADFDIKSQVSDLYTRVGLLESSGGGSGGGTTTWNTAHSVEGTSLWLSTDSTKRYEVMLISKHGMGDNTFTSSVFLLPSGTDMNMAVTNLKIPVLAADYSDTENYWTVNYDPPAMQYSITIYYNGDISPIHDITCYFREV